MRVLFLILIVLFVSACKEKSAKTADTGSNDSTTFFQVSDYIKSQVKEVSTTPYFIYKLTSHGQKKDSITSNNLEVSELSKQFTIPDLNDPAVKKYFAETVFFDETTKTYSISYSTSNKELNLQSVTVLLKEDGKTVKRIFIRKFYNYNDSSAIEQLSWKPNESFQINRLVQHPNNKETSKETNVVWNAKDKEL
jgi:hypothetical protein